MKSRREVFEEQRRPRFGTANPERMRAAFWEEMVRERYGPWDVREFFKVPLSREDGPIWTFHRMGGTRTELPDGRTICVGGEHEDWYDPDFCIYNDVIVLGPGGEIEIYGYPKEVFPPTDFHTATLVGNRILIIGSIGYKDERYEGKTPVYILDPANYKILKMETSGEGPGWISEHRAELNESGNVEIRRGKYLFSDGKTFRRNFEDYSLNVDSGVWHRLTNRNWILFKISQADGQLFGLDQPLKAEPLAPHGAALEKAPGEMGEMYRTIVAGLPVCLIVGIKYIEVVIEASPSDDVSRAIAEEIRGNTEAAVQQSCVVERG